MGGDERQFARKPRAESLEVIDDLRPGTYTVTQAQVPGFDSEETALIGVSCAGFVDAAATNLALRWLPADVVGAFT